MRISQKAFLAGVVVAGMGLLAAPRAMATGYGSCSSFSPTVEVKAGPCPVSSTSPSACEASGPYTGIKYKITGSPSHVATVVTANNTVVSVPGNQFYSPCVGDPVTGLGKNSCHERAVKVNPDAYTSEFWLVVEGQKTSVLQSIAAKKGSCTKALAVVGLGFDVNPFQAAQKTETINFKGCAVDFVRDVLTGQVVSAELNLDQSAHALCPVTSGPCCSQVIVSTVDKLSLTLDGVGSLGAGQFGEGYVSSGENSCTTRVIGGRVYTWGSPCP